MRVSTVEQLRAAIENSINDIELTNGIYSIDKAIDIIGKSNIVIRGVKGAVLTSRRAITPIFERFKDNIFFCKLSPSLGIDNVIVNGEPWSICRYPEYDGDAILNGSAIYPTHEISKWNNPYGVMRALHDHDWGGNSYIIKGKKPDGSLNLEWVGDNNRGDKYNAKYVVIEGVLELLKSKKSWCYDERSGYLYVLPQDPAKLADCEIEIVTQHNILNIKDCKNIRIEGLELIDTARSTFRFPFERPLRGDWGIQRTGCIYINGCENVTIKDSNFRRIGSNCVMIDGNCSDIDITDCDFTDCGSSGVLIVGSESACRDSSNWENHKTTILDTTVGALNDEYPKRINVQNCLFHNLGLSEKQSSAVCMSISANVSVINCTIHRMPRAGINISDGCFGGHIIQGNELYDCVRETCDHGPINAWGRDRFWSYKGYNTTGGNGKFKRPYALLDAVNPTKIVGNRLYATSGFGIDLDDGSSNYEITNNVTIGVGIKLREGFDRYVHHNVLIGSCFDLHCSYALNNDIITNNLIVSSKAFNTILINRGHTTKIYDNYYCHANGYKKLDTSPKDMSNLTTNLYDYSFVRMIDGFDNFPLTFGCTRNTPPIIKNINTPTDNVKHIKVCGVKFVQIDEGTRSACGLDRDSGAYVVSVSPFSPLRKRLKKGDALTQIGNVPIDSPNDISSVGLKKEKLVLFRNQLSIEV